MKSYLDWFERVPTSQASQSPLSAPGTALWSAATHQPWEAHVAKAPCSTLVLYSQQTRTPLAALVVQARDQYCPVAVTERPSPAGEADVPYFQGLFRFPEQVLDLTLVNLSRNSYLNFNLIHKPGFRQRVKDPGPGAGLNEINELRPGEAYTVQADQRTGQELVLSGLFDHRGKAAAPVSVAESEAKEAPATSRGFYVYLSVVPEQGTAHATLFREGTFWKPTSTLLLPPSSPRALSSRVPSSPVARSSSSPMSHSSGAHCDFGLGAQAQAQSVGLGWGDPTLGRSPWSYETEELSPPVYRSLPVTDGRAKGAPSQASLPLAQSAAGFVCGPEPSARLVAESSAEPSLFQPLDLGTAQAGRLTHGQSVQVTSAATDRQYAFDASAQSAVLCFSIAPSLELLSLSRDALRSRAQALLQAFQQEQQRAQGRRLLETLPRVYQTTDVCLMDLESPADTVVCLCGHQCLGHESASALLNADSPTCPLCREPIVALVRADCLDPV